MAATVTLVCTHPTLGSKTLTLSEPFASRMRTRFETCGWTVTPVSQP